MKLEPLWDRVAIRRMEKVNGIVIPDSIHTADTLGRGTVEAVGEGVRKIKVGQDVFFCHPRNGPIDLVHFDGRDYVLVTEALIVARVTDA